MFRALNMTAAVAALVLAAYRCRALIRQRSGLRETLRSGHRAATAVLWGAFILWVLISTAVNGLTTEAVHGLPYRNIGVPLLTAFIVIYLWASSEIRRESLRRYIVEIYIAAADALAIAVLYDIVTGSISAFHEKKEVSAVFFNGNHYGYFLVMAILLGAGLYLFGDSRRAAFGALSASLNSVVLVINHSMGSILAVIAVMVLTGIYITVCNRQRVKRLTLMLAAAAVIIIAALALSSDIQKEFVKFAADMSDILSGRMKDSTGHNRIKVWRLTADYILARPLFGYGCEGISLDMYEETAISNPHNEFLTYAVYYGIPAALLYTAAVITTLAESVRKMHGPDVWSAVSCMAAAGYFVSSVTGVSMFYITPFFFVFAGIAMTAKTSRL